MVAREEARSLLGGKALVQRVRKQKRRARHKGKWEDYGKEQLRGDHSPPSKGRRQYKEGQVNHVSEKSFIF